MHLHDYGGNLLGVQNRERFHLVAEKVEAIAMAPTPRNVRELRSYLGCLNYYAKFLPNLSSALEPLHRLLAKDTFLGVRSRKLLSRVISRW